MIIFCWMVLEETENGVKECQICTEFFKHVYSFSDFNVRYTGLHNATLPKENENLLPKKLYTPPSKIQKTNLPLAKEGIVRMALGIMEHIVSHTFQMKPEYVAVEISYPNI